MSYSIIYKKAFVKIDGDKFLPFVQIGDSNCTLTGHNGREVRARSWELLNWICDSNGFTNEKIIEKVLNEGLQRWIQYGNPPQEIEASYGSYLSLKVGSKYLSLKAMKAYFINACKSAFTLDDLNKEHGITIQLNVPYYTKKELKEQGMSIAEPVFLKTNQDLIGTIQTWSLEYGNKFSPNFINLGPQWAIESFLEKKSSENRNKRNNARCSKISLRSPIAFVLKGTEVQGYYVKSTSKGYKYVGQSYGAKAFLTRVEAEKFMKNFRYKEDFTIERIAETYGIFYFNVTTKQAAQYKQLIETYKEEAKLNDCLRFPNEDFIKMNFEAIKAHAQNKMKKGLYVSEKTKTLLGLAA